MRIHLITIGSTMDEDLDVAEMLNAEGHMLVDKSEHAEAVFIWNKQATPVYVCNTDPGTTPTLVYSLHAMRVFLREQASTGRPGRNYGSHV